MSTISEEERLGLNWDDKASVALDFIAYEIFCIKCRSSGQYPIRWWCMGKEYKDGYREIAKGTIDLWANEEKKAMCGEKDES